jgi:hypothetical protein
MARHIASIADGRVVTWYSDDDPIPAGFVFVPDALYDKHASGEIADGKSLARAALAANAEVGMAHQNVAVPPPPKKAKEDPANVDPEKIEHGEPTSPEVTQFPTQGKTMRA